MVYFEHVIAYWVKSHFMYILKNDELEDRSRWINKALCQASRYLVLAEKVVNGCTMKVKNYQRAFTCSKSKT